jgi:DNA-binding MarR family transcriptional regulator
MSHPTTALSELVHQRARLGILAVVHEADRAEFRFLQDTLELTSGNLSRHVQALEEGGLISVERGFQGRRARTWVRITKAGRQALVEEIAQLKMLITRVEAAGAEGEETGGGDTSGDMTGPAQRRGG